MHLNYERIFHQVMASMARLFFLIENTLLPFFLSCCSSWRNCFLNFFLCLGKRALYHGTVTVYIMSAYLNEKTPLGLVVHHTVPDPESRVRSPLTQAIPPQGAFSISSSPLISGKNKPSSPGSPVRMGNSEALMYSHGSVSPKHSAKKLAKMWGYSKQGFKRQAVKHYKNAMLTPKSKEPTGFLRSSNRFGPNREYKAPTNEEIASTSIRVRSPNSPSLSRSPEFSTAALSNELSLYEKRNNPDRQSVPVRTAHTVQTAPRERQYRHPRDMEQRLIVVEKRNAELSEALKVTRNELFETREKLEGSEKRLIYARKKESTLLVLVKDVLNRWERTKNSGSGSLADRLSAEKLSATVDSVLGHSRMSVTSPSSTKSPRTKTSNQYGTDDINREIDKKINAIEELLKLSS